MAWTSPSGTGSGPSVPSASVDSEVVLFDGTTGAALKRASATGIAKVTAGVLSAAVAGTDYQGGDATLTAWAAAGSQGLPYFSGVDTVSTLTLAADKGIYATGAGGLATFDLSSFARTTLGSVDGSAWRTQIGAALASADYLVKTANGDLSAERVVTDSNSVFVDWATAGQAIPRAGAPRAEIVTTTTWWSVPQQGGCATLTTTATIDDGMHAVPFVATRTGTIDLVAVEITSGTGAGEEHIVAIYEDDGTLYPGALVSSSGSIDGSTTGVKTASVSAAVKAGKMYWMVLYSELAATFRAIGVGTTIPLLGFETTLGITGPVVRYRATRAWDGTAPATYPAGATIGTSNAISALAAVWYRWGA